MGRSPLWGLAANRPDLYPQPAGSERQCGCLQRGTTPVHTGIEAPSEEIKRCCGNQPAIPAAAKGTRVIPARFRNAYTAQPPKRRNTTPKIQNHKSVPALQITGLAAIAAVMCLPTTKRTISSVQCSAMPGKSEFAQ